MPSCLAYGLRISRDLQLAEAGHDAMVLPPRSTSNMLIAAKSEGRCKVQTDAVWYPTLGSLMWRYFDGR